MQNMIQRIHAKWHGLYLRLVRASYVRATSLLDRHAKVICYTGGSILIAASFVSNASAQSQNYDKQIVYGLCAVLDLLMGSYGALVMAVAGITAIVTAAMGAYKPAMSVLVIGAGTFLVEPMIELFYGVPGCTTFIFDRKVPVFPK